MLDVKDRLAALGEMLGLMLKHWVWALTSSGVVAVLGLAANWTLLYAQSSPNKPNLTPLVEKGVIVWAALAIPFAAYLAWCDQRTTLRDTREKQSTLESEMSGVQAELTEARKELATANANLLLEKQKNTPNLRGQIKQVMFGGELDGMASKLGIVAVATISNIPPGAASIADDYTLSIIKDGVRISCEVLYLSDSVQATDTLGRALKYGSADALYNKTTPTPIPSGGAQTGVLVAAILDSQIDFLDRGTMLLSFADVLGKRYEAGWLLRLELDSPMHYIPGTTLLAVDSDSAPPAQS